MADDWTSLVPQLESEWNLPPGLMHAVIQTESSGRTDAVSPKGALGLMQIMPATARSYGVDNAARLHDPETNLQVGARHLSMLLNKYQGDIPSTLADYNGGPKAIIHPPAETKSYISKVMDLLSPTSAEAAEEDPLKGFTRVDAPTGATAIPRLEGRGERIPTTAVGAVPVGGGGPSEPVITDPLEGFHPVGRKLIDPMGGLPAAPTPIAPAGPAELSSIPSKDQFNIKFHVQRGDNEGLKKYLTGAGYTPVGEDANSVTFRDKAGRMYRSDDPALLPMAVNALPAVGQIGGTLGGGALTGGLGGEVAGAGIGEAAGEQAQRAILKHYGVPLEPQSLTTLKNNPLINPAIAAATQGVVGGVVPAVARGLSRYGVATEAAAQREGEIAEAGEKAAAAQQRSLLSQGLDVAKKGEEIGREQITAAEEQARQSIAGQQEAGELGKVLGSTPEAAAERSGPMIQGGQAWAAEPYFKGVNNLQERQGKLFDDLLKPVAKERVNLDLGAAIDSLDAQPYLTGVSPNVRRLAQESRETTASGSNLDDILHQHMGDTEFEREAPSIHQRYQALLDANKRGPDPARVIGRGKWKPAETFTFQTKKHGIQVIPVTNLQQTSGATVEDLSALRSKWGEIARSRSAKPIDKAYAHDVMNHINEGLFTVKGLDDPGSQLALKTARTEYAKFKGYFSPTLTAKMVATHDPIEVADVIFDANPGVAKNLIDGLKDDPESMDQLRSSYADKIISMQKKGPSGAVVPDIQGSRLALSIHDKNGILARLYPDSQYKNVKAWADTQNFRPFYERAIGTPEGQVAYKQALADALNTPEGKKLEHKLAQLQQKQLEYAREPFPGYVGRRTEERTTAELSPDQAAAQAIAPNKETFRGGGLGGYIKRRAAFQFISGNTRNPIVFAIAGAQIGYDKLWSIAMQNPETATAWYNFIRKFGEPSPYRKGAKAFIDFLSAGVTNELRQQPGAGTNPNP